MNRTMSDLIVEYKESRKRLRRHLSTTPDISFADRGLFNSMIRDLTWDIFYMEHGYTMEESSLYSSDVPIHYVDPTLLDNIEPECSQYMLSTQQMFDMRGIDEQVSIHMTISALFNSLSKRQYEAVLLRAEGFSERELAREMGITRRSVRRHLSRAKEKLKDLCNNR